MTGVARIGPRSAASPRRRAPVLYIEAHPADVALMDDYLSGLEDFSLAVAGSVEQAIASARRIPPSIVLVDVGLVGEPGGVERLARLRALPELRDVPVIALSGTAHPRARALARHLGFHRFFTKPLNLELLGDAMAQVVPSAAR